MKTKYLETRDQIAAITSDVRMKIVQSLRDGEASIAEIAARLSRTPHSLYHHMHVLVETGIVKTTGTRKVGKRVETLYATAAEEYEIRHDPKSLKSRRTFRTAIRSIVRLTGHDVERAIMEGRVVKSGPSRNTSLHRHDVRLDKRQVEEVMKHLDAIGEILSKADSKGQPFSCTYLFHPAVR